MAFPVKNIRSAYTMFKKLETAMVNEEVRGEQNVNGIINKKGLRDFLSLDENQGDDIRGFARFLDGQRNAIDTNKDGAVTIAETANFLKQQGLRW